MDGQTQLVDVKSLKSLQKVVSMRLDVLKSFSILHVVSFKSR